MFRGVSRRGLVLFCGVVSRNGVDRIVRCSLVASRPRWHLITLGQVCCGLHCSLVATWGRGVLFVRSMSLVSQKTSDFAIPSYREFDHRRISSLLLRGALQVLRRCHVRASSSNRTTAHRLSHPYNIVKARPSPSRKPITEAKRPLKRTRPVWTHSGRLTSSFPVPLFPPHPVRHGSSAT